MHTATSQSPIDLMRFTYTHTHSHIYLGCSHAYTRTLTRSASQPVCHKTVAVLPHTHTLARTPANLRQQQPLWQSANTNTHTRISSVLSDLCVRVSVAPRGSIVASICARAHTHSHTQSSLLLRIQIIVAYWYIHSSGCVCVFVCVCRRISFIGAVRPAASAPKTRRQFHSRCDRVRTTITSPLQSHTHTHSQRLTAHTLIVIVIVVVVFVSVCYL